MLRRLNAAVSIADTPEDIASAEKIIFPGVGAFDDVAERLVTSGLRAALLETIRKGTPFLGICVGMQMLVDQSNEGHAKGLGLIPGACLRFPSFLTADIRGVTRPLPVPHMGWNKLQMPREHKLFSGLPADARFYFVHSYYVQPEDERAVIAESEYGMKFAAAIESDNVFGVQFHPEKSHRFGKLILENFCALR